MRTHRNIIAATFCFWLCAVSAGAEAPETELKFAAGLRDLAYYDLAAERFRQLDWRWQKNPEFRGKVSEGLIETYLATAKSADTPAEILRYIGLATDELGPYLETDLKPDRRNRLLMKQGTLLLERGALTREVYRRKPKGADLPAVATEGEAAFDQAVKVYQQAVQGFKTIVKRIEAKHDVNDEDRRIRRESLNQQIVAETQIGWSRYRRAQLYRDQGKTAQAGSELNTAVAIFKDLSAAHKDIAAGLSATLGWALCVQALGQHEQAIKTFKEVYVPNAPQELQLMLFQAEYEMAASQVALKRYEDALETLEVALKDYRRVLSPQQAQAWRLRYARTLGRAADAFGMDAEKRLKEAAKLKAELKKKEDPLVRRKILRLEREAAATAEAARKRYERAVGEVRKLTAEDSLYSQEASLLLGQWIAAGGLEKQRQATDYFADGERLLEAGKHAGAVAAYRGAIRRSRELGPDKILRRDAWIQMGKAYALQKKHYEAGLVLGYVARLYPESEYAEKSAVYSAMLLGAQYEKGKSRFEAQTYLDAQEVLVERFAHTDAAKRAAFRLGDVRRAQKQYKQAAHFYGKVDAASEFYERAGFLTAWCLWQDFLQQQADGGSAGAGHASVEAIENHVRKFLTWTQTQPAAAPEIAKARRLWTAKSRVLLAEMFLYRERYKDVLHILSDAVFARMKQLPAGNERLLARARLHRLHAYCALETLDSVRQAGLEMKALREETYLKDPKKKSTAARLVGTTFLKLAEVQGEKVTPERRARDPLITDLLANAQKYLVLSLELNKDVTVKEYEEIASALHQAGAYPQAARTFEALVKRLGADPKHAALRQDAQRWVGTCYKDGGEWQKAAETFKALVKDYPRWMAVRRDLALCYQSDALRQYAEAEKHWRTVEQNYSIGKPEWFEARVHRVETLAKAGRKSLALQMLAAMVVPYPDLGGPAWEKRILSLVNSDFTRAQKETFLKLRKQSLETAG